MMWQSHQDPIAECGPLARGLDRGGELIMGLGVSLALVALAAASSGALLTGIVMSLGGLFMRAGATVVAVHEMHARGISGPEPRPGRDGRVPQNEHEDAELFAKEHTNLQAGFVAMLEEKQQQRRGEPRGM